MEKGQVPLQALGPILTVGMNTGASLEPIPEQQDGSKPDTQSPEPWTGPPTQADIEFRIKELQNRHFLLLQMQRFRKKTQGNDVGTTEGMTRENSDQLCELETIQQELHELLGKKEELEKQRNGFKLRENKGQQGAHPAFCKPETPRGGIYMLPPPQLAEDDFTLERRGTMRPAAETPAGSVIPVDSLSKTPGVTRCPSCEEVVFTETRRRVGSAAWTTCFLCALSGCVAGCCLIPFCMSRLRDVQHQCPKCRASIHTHQPF